MTMHDARILVVGASAGIGRAFAQHAAAAGARVCASARRASLLDELEGCHGIPADITDPAACRQVVAEAVEHLGSIDLLLLAVGAGSLARIEEADASAWARQYAVNVIGPTCITGAALPHLSDDAIVSFLSSESTHEPRWGVAGYTASKSALDATIRSWQIEHPERRFQRIVMGATFPTDFASGFDTALLGTALERWHAAGISMASMATDDVGRHLAEVLAVLLAHPGIDVPDICLDPRGEPWSEENGA